MKSNLITKRPGGPTCPMTVDWLVLMDVTHSTPLSHVLNIYCVTITLELGVRKARETLSWLVGLLLKHRSR